MENYYKIKWRVQMALEKIYWWNRPKKIKKSIEKKKLIRSWRIWMVLGRICW